MRNFKKKIYIIWKKYLKKWFAFFYLFIIKQLKSSILVSKKKETNFFSFQFSLNIKTAFIPIWGHVFRYKIRLKFFPKIFFLLDSLYNELYVTYSIELNSFNCLFTLFGCFLFLKFRTEMFRFKTITHFFLFKIKPFSFTMS